MDVPRPTAARNKKIKRIIYLVVVLIGASAVTFGLSRMKPAAPSVDSGTLWMNTVKRGDMLVDVRGLGTLVPEDIRWIPASRDGMIEQINVRIGDTVKPDTILMVLSNPDMEQAVVDAELQVKASEADLENTKATFRTTLLNQQTTQATAEANAKQARLQANANQELAKDGLVGDLTVKLSIVNAENLEAQNEMEKKRVAINEQSGQAQIAAAQAHLDELRAAYELRKAQVDQLKVRAGVAGVIQQLAADGLPQVEAGQKVTMGTILSKIAQPGRLKAELKIAETQAKDIAIGQVASIDTRNGIIPGHVIRIDPAATNGTVTVDCSLEGELPKGARPDLSVDGTVEIQRLSNIMYVERPAYGQANATVGIFKVLPTNEAVRVQVKLGRSAVNTIEILDGLQVGDKVILSDMSTWDAVDRVKLN